MAIDVRDQDFESVVLEGSKKGPVVVDFWASWCAPCRSLGPILERVAEETGVTLVKMDVDANPAVSGAFGIRSIPTVYAFKDGKIVDQFVGALPEQQVRHFFKGLGPSEADLLVQRAEDAPEVQREALLRAALHVDRGHRGAVLALASLLAARGDGDEARSLLGRIPEDGDVRRILATLDLQGSDADVEELRRRLESSPGDADAMVAVARAEAAAGEHAAALERLLGAVRLGSSEARQVMVDVFHVLGDDHPLTHAYRPKLAAALF